MTIVRGTRLGPYEILAPLGAGGMAVVYRARDTKLQRTVAIKILNATADATASGRLLDEARAASGLNHPNICTIYEVAEVGGQAFIVMEHVEGQPLSQLIPRHGQAIDSVTGYGTQIASAVAHAHAHGIIHRDLKSSNIVITPEGRAKVLDFGIARRIEPEDLEAVTHSGRMLEQADALAGTLACMAPEALRARPADARSDIWSLGVLLYEMASGELPFKGQTAFEITAAILHEPLAPLPSRVPAVLRSIIQKCLSKEPGQRYQQASEVRAALETIESQPSAARLAHAAWARHGRQLLSLAAILALLIIGFLAWNPGGWRDRALGRVGAPAVQSLAVLPLENLSGDPEQEYFADGMTDALIGELGQIHALRVISRTSVAQYRRAAKPVRQIAKELNVNTIVEGSVQRSANKVGISVRLIDATTDSQIWSHAYERDAQDVLSLQREVARHVAAEIRIHLSPSEQARLRHVASVDPHAYDACLKARFYLTSSRTEENLKRALQRFEECIAIDSNYASAYSGLAETYIAIADWGYLLPVQAIEHAKSSAMRALQLDSALAEGHAVLASINGFHNWDWAEAERAFVRAIQLNPSDSTTRSRHAQYLMVIGRHEASIAERQVARLLDPRAPGRIVNLGISHYFARRYDAAIKIWQDALALEPKLPGAHYYLGRAYVQTGMYGEAIKELEIALRLFRDRPGNKAKLAYAYASAGNGDRARRLLDELEATAKLQYVSPTDLAMVQSRLGRTDEAFRSLEKAYAMHDGELCYLQTAPEFDHLRSDRRLDALLRRLGLAQ